MAKITSDTRHDTCEMICYVHPWETHYAKLLCKPHNKFVQWVGKKDIPALREIGVEVKNKVKWKKQKPNK